MQVASVGKWQQSFAFQHPQFGANIKGHSKTKSKKLKKEGIGLVISTLLQLDIVQCRHQTTNSDKRILSDSAHFENLIFFF